jgi:hypothetical protein
MIIIISDFPQKKKKKEMMEKKENMCGIWSLA